MSPAGSKAKSPKPPKEKLDYGKSSGPRDKIVPQPSREPVPMKRHKGLFLALMGVFVAWVGVMLGLYLTTVRPREHSAPPAPPAPGATSRALAGPASALPSP
jgi:hypothetical protein